ESASAGQAFGRGEVPDPGDLFAAQGSDDDKEFVLFPGSDDPSHITPSELFGSDGRGSVDDLKNLWGDDSAITDKTGNVQKFLESGSNPRARAYQTLKASKSHAHPDLSKDQIFDTSKHVLEEIFSG